MITGPGYIDQLACEQKKKESCGTWTVELLRGKAQVSDNGPLLGPRPLTGAAAAAAASIFANSWPSKSLSRKTSSWKTFRQLPMIDVASKPPASFSIESKGHGSA